MLDQRSHPIVHIMVAQGRAWTRYTLVVLVVLALTVSSGAAQGNQTTTLSAGKGCHMRRDCTCTHLRPLKCYDYATSVTLHNTPSVWTRVHRI